MPHTMPRDVVGTMRAAADEFLASNETFPRFDELTETASRLRSHLQVLVPIVETAARTLPAGDTRRGAALLTVENARARLKAGPGVGLVSATQHARSLARELRALCHHHDILTGAGAAQ